MISEIDNFKRTNMASKWPHLSRSILADRFTEFLYDPLTTGLWVQQGALGLCGPAAFLSAWLCRDHIGAIRFAMDLYDNGKSSIGDYEVKPCTELLECNYCNIPWSKAATPQAEWMIMSSLRDEEDSFFDYEGTPDEEFEASSIPSEIKKWLEKTGLYSSVLNDTATFPLKWKPLRKGIDHALSLNPDDYTDVILMINSTLLGAQAQANGFAQVFNNDVPNHFIGLLSKIQVTESNLLRMSYFTWGSFYERDFHPDEFDRNYYGAIIAKAKAPKIPLPLKLSRVPNKPEGLSAKYENQILTIYWMVSSFNDIGYKVEQKIGGSQQYGTGEPGFVYQQTIIAHRPSTDGANYQISLPDPGIYTYRVSASNKIGISPYSDYVVVEVPSGDITIISDSDPRAIAAPPHVKGINIIKGTRNGFSEWEDGNERANCRKSIMRYSAYWSDESKLTRKLIIDKNEPVKPNQLTTLVIEFSEAMRPDTVKLYVVGTTPDGNTVNLPVVMSPVREFNDDVFCGSAQFSNPWKQNYTLRLEIQGCSNLAPFPWQSVQRNVLDSNPATIAKVLQSPPYFPVSNYEPGADRNYKFEVGTHIETLRVDSHEQNDDFSSATRVELQMPSSDDGKETTLKLESVMLDPDPQNPLTLHDSTDKDFFLVEYKSSKFDDDCPLDEPVISGLNHFSGVTIMFMPPSFSVLITHLDENCVDIGIYKSDIYNRELVGNFTGDSSARCYNPTRIAPDRKFYIRISNSDFSSQGAVSYRIKFAYASYHGLIIRIINSPIQRTRPDPRQRFFDRLYNVIDLIRSPELLFKKDPRVSDSFIIPDIKIFIEQYEHFLLDPMTKRDFNEMRRRDSTEMIHSEILALGKIAQRVGLDDLAERLFWDSFYRYGRNGKEGMQCEILKKMKHLYSKTGNLKKMNKICELERNI